ncbi:MAG: hypothetical protein Q9216_006948, partial [Gyalolechia sp. 2 TL-2023]
CRGIWAPIRIGGMLDVSPEGIWEFSPFTAGSTIGKILGIGVLTMGSLWIERVWKASERSSDSTSDLIVTGLGDELDLCNFLGALGWDGKHILMIQRKGSRSNKRGDELE